MAQVITGSLIFAATLALIMIRPFHLTEATIAASGGLLMLVSGIVSPRDALGTLLGQWNIYGFFLGLMLISAIADAAGIFDMLAYQAARLAGGRTRDLTEAQSLSSAACRPKGSGRAARDEPGRPEPCAQALGLCPADAQWRRGNCGHHAPRAQARPPG